MVIIVWMFQCVNLLNLFLMISENCPLSTNSMPPLAKILNSYPHLLENWLLSKTWISHHVSHLNLFQIALESSHLLKA